MRFTKQVLCLLASVAIVPGFPPLDRAYGAAQPISVRLAVGFPKPDESAGDYLARTDKSKQTLAVGLYAAELTALIRNDIDVPILLQGVYWADHEDVSDTAFEVVCAGLVGEKSDGTMSYNQNVQCLGGVFETGLVFPGEEKVGGAAVTPQHDGKHVLTIRYIPLKGDALKDVCFPTGANNAFEIVFAPLTPEGLKKLGENRNRRGEYRVTCRGDYKSLIETVSVPLQLPIRNDPANRLTGGISADRAAHLAGLDPLKDDYLAFYREPIHAWLFVGRDKKAVALRLEKGEWKRIQLGLMERTVPAWLCRKNGGTNMFLRPDAFSDIIDVKTPQPGLLRGTPSGNLYRPATPGITYVPPEKLWDILVRARDRSIEIRHVSYHEDHGPTTVPYGSSRALSAGVVFSDTGQWLHPKIEPKPRTSEERTQHN